jgi:hypothetical protein
MKRFSVFLCAVVLVLVTVGLAGAIPINFNLSGANSSVELSNVSTLGWTWVTAEIMDTLENEAFILHDGQSSTFDFFKVTVGGFIGVGSADVTATLAFDEPPSSGTGDGSGGWFTFLGVLSAGHLIWDTQPETVFLDNGDFFDITFHDLEVGGIGNWAMIQATVTAHAAPIPEPATMLLLGTGLFGLAGVGRKKFFKKS